MRLLTPLALLALLLPCATSQAEPPSGNTTPWNVSTAPPEPPAPTPEGSLSFRHYAGTDRDGLLPYRAGGSRRNDEVLAVDVSAVMARCADGSQLITALVIGGRLTPLDKRCPDDVPQERDALPCDPGRWTCSTRPSP